MEVSPERAKETYNTDSLVLPNSVRPMQTRGLYVATAVLIILGGLWYWSQHRKPSEDTSKSASEVPPSILKLDQNSITRVELNKKDSVPVILEKASGEWQITAPNPLHADQSAVSALLGTLASLNSERVIADKDYNPAQYGLVPAALQVNVAEKDKSQKLLIGDDTPTGGAVYAMLAGDPRVFTIASYTKNSLDKGLNDLRDKRLITLAAEKISRVELLKKGQDIEFGRNQDAWQILKPKSLRADGTQVGDLVRELTEAKMDTDAASVFAKASPVAIAKVTDESGTQQLEIRQSKSDYYAKSSAVEGAFKVDSALGKAVEKKLDDFRNKALFDSGYTTPSKIEVHDGQQSLFLTRGSAGEDDWWTNGKKVDAAKASDVVSKLRDLSATGFADSGFSHPTIELIVTSNDAKRVEDVLIAKSADGYIAQRKSEPTLYKLSASAVDDLVKSAGVIH
jgi:hypothetical protein